MSIDAGDGAVQSARLDILRRNLGARLATYRTAAGVSQPELGQAIGRTRSMVSKIEHGTRGMPTTLWKITDDMCGAHGALIAEHSTLAQAEQDYRAQCRTHRRHMQIQQAGTRTQARSRSAWPAPVPSSGVLSRNGDDTWPGKGLVSGQSAGLAEEFMAVVTKIVRSVGRRDAMRLVGGALAAVGLSGLDADEYTRVTHAIEAPHRVDAQVVESLAVMLAYCKRLEDTLGPSQVLDTVIAQHGIVRRLLTGGCPTQLRKPLSLIDSTMASTIGGYLGDMGHPDLARGYFEHARKAAHEAANPVCAAYAVINTSFAAFLRGDICAALDTAAAARNLAARTDDLRLKALAEEQAAGAYALDNQYGPCMVACDRAHDFLGNITENTPQSPAYWVHEGTLDSKRSTFFSLLDRPKQAIEAATSALTQFDRTYIGLYTRCQIRLGHALILDKDITEATHVLGEAAHQARLSPRLTTELHTTRALMQPWQHTHAVTTLDTQLQACGLLPTHQTKNTTPH